MKRRLMQALLLLSWSCLTPMVQAQPSEQEQYHLQEMKERAEKLQLQQQEAMQQARQNSERMRIQHPPRPLLQPRMRESTEATYRRLDDNLAKATLALEALKNKTKTAAYISAQVELAKAYYAEREREKAAAIYSKAFRNYLDLENNPVAEKEARASLWKHLGYLPEHEFESDYFKLLKKSLEAKENYRDLAANIREAASEQNTLERTPRFDELAFYNKTVDVISKAQNPDANLLAEVLASYGNELTQHGRLKEAASVYERISMLSSTVPTEWERAEWDLQLYYVQHRMDAEANAHFSKLPITTYALSIRGESLATAYLNKNQKDNAVKVLKMLADHPDPNTLNNVDRILEPLIRGQINSGNLDEARNLLTYRVELAKRYPSDYQATEWFLKLSQIDLALGKKEESDKLFKQVKIYTALKHGDMNKLNDARAKMIKAISK